jgi:uncharacterized protein (TIGR04255 family)
MQPPLVEVVLELHFDTVQMAGERLQFFSALSDATSVTADSLRIVSRRGVSFPALRSEWNPLLDTFFTSFAITEVKKISLAYQNEIPIEDLRSFRNYLNINFEMPEILQERVEFFRSEFTYQYAFGAIKVWLQPDWDEELDTYCVQLNLAAQHTGSVRSEDLYPAIQRLHEGIKDVFRQILSEDYIRSLPQ